MTQPRMPAIGDHVWRAAVSGSGPDARPGFDGYVLGEAADGGWTTLVLPKGTPEIVIPASLNPRENFYGQETHGVEQRAPIRVATLFLVRQLHGWRWVPRELRPAVMMGDRIIWREPFTPFSGLVVDVVATQFGSEWMVQHTGGLARFDRHSGEIAKAIAGLDGWSWEPAGWPGEPKGGP